MLTFPSTLQDIPVQVFYGVHRKDLRVEGNMYPPILFWFKKAHALAERVECVDASGFPDIIAMRGEHYACVECKLFRGKVFTTFEKALHWQYGQLARAVLMMESAMPYALAVGHQKTIYFIVRAGNVSPIIAEIVRLVPLRYLMPSQSAT